jgi:hypothetical protein
MNGTKIAQRWRAERNRKAAQQRQARCECDISCFQNFIFLLLVLAFLKANGIRKKAYRGIEPRCRSFPILAYDRVGGPGGISGLGPDRLGPQGPGGAPPLASFTGLRSRTLISFLAFFVLFCISVFPSSVRLLWLLLIGNSLLPFTDVLRKIL